VDYVEKLREPRKIVEGIWSTQNRRVRLLSESQWLAYQSVHDELEHLAKAKGLVQGTPADCKKELEAAGKLTALKVNETLGATDAMANLFGALERAARTRCSGVALERARARLSEFSAALVDTEKQVGDTVETLRDQVLCDMFIPIAVQVLDAPMQPADRCPGTLDAAGTCPPASETERTGWIIKRSKDYFEIIKKPALDVVNQHTLIRAIYSYLNARGWGFVGVTPETIGHKEPHPAFHRKIQEWIRYPELVMQVTKWASDAKIVNWPGYVDKELVKAGQTSPLEPFCATRGTVLQDLETVAALDADHGKSAERLRVALGRICEGPAGGNWGQLAAKASYDAIASAASDRQTSRLFRCTKRGFALRRNEKGLFHFAVAHLGEHTGPDLIPLVWGGAPYWAKDLTPPERVVAARWKATMVALTVRNGADADQMSADLAVLTQPATARR
jgi:hypothetical protein